MYIIKPPFSELIPTVCICFWLVIHRDLAPTQHCVFQGLLEEKSPQEVKYNSNSTVVKYTNLKKYNMLSLLNHQKFGSKAN